MGSFQVWDIEFSEEKDRQKFEKLYKLQIQKILVDENSDSNNFGAWTMMRNPYLNPIYFMGFLGYGDSTEILKECKKKGIKIRFFAFNSINDYNSNWTKLRGKW